MYFVPWQKGQKQNQCCVDDKMRIWLKIDWVIDVGRNSAPCRSVSLWTGKGLCSDIPVGQRILPKIGPDVKNQRWTLITARVSSATSSGAPPVQWRCSWLSLQERRTAPRCYCSPRARLHLPQTGGFKWHKHGREQRKKGIGQLLRKCGEKWSMEEVVTWWRAGLLQWADSRPDSLTQQQIQLYQRDRGPL